MHARIRPLSQVWRVESEIRPSSYWERLITALGIDIDELFRGESRTQIAPGPAGAFRALTLYSSVGKAGA
jgi:hypothetical protein